MKKLNLNENFISRIWQDKIYYEGLKTTGGKPVEILDYGFKNKDSGADFKNAKIKIGDNIFSGDIEIHRSPGDWKNHNHKGDEKYNRVILQVAFWGDDFPYETELPKVMKSREVPTVILSEFLTKSIHEIWKDIIENPSSEFRLPCFPVNEKVSSDLKISFIRTLSLKRLSYRSERLRNRLEEFEDIDGTDGKKYNWERLLFEYTLEALGFSKNKEQFLKFAVNLDFHKIRKSNLQSPELEALFFGAAGLLSNLKYKDDYIEKIKKHWLVLKEKFKPVIMNKSEWHFFRLRPQNFPTVRMAFAAAFFNELVNNNFLKRIILCFEKSKNTKKDITELFLGINLPAYWQNHYVFGKEVSTQLKSIGGERIRDIITNVVLPLLYLYAIKFDKDLLMEKVMDYYVNKVDKGINEITKVMQVQLGIPAKSISDNQGLIHLHNFYCVKSRCGECEIGDKLFGKGNSEDVLKIILY